mmetsp:Transcript_109214/g.170779  ORF Transcript_109214/g.170779 Transcript_109214/m.170779 type:complete len:178 (+) Transcript_109214:1642-2175(+)
MYAATTGASDTFVIELETTPKGPEASSLALEEPETYREESVTVLVFAAPAGNRLEESALVVDAQLATSEAIAVREVPTGPEAIEISFVLELQLDSKDDPPDANCPTGKGRIGPTFNIAFLINLVDSDEMLLAAFAISSGKCGTIFLGDPVFAGEVAGLVTAVVVAEVTLPPSEVGGI